MSVADACKSTVHPVTLEQLNLEIQDLRSVVDKIFLKIDGSLKSLYTVAEVARMTGRSEYTVRRWVLEKRLQAERVSGTGPRGKLLIRREEISRLIGSGKGDLLSGIETGASSALNESIPSR